MPHWILDCSWLTAGSEQENSPVRGMSVPMTMPVTASLAGGCGRPGQLHITEAVEGEMRLPRFHAAALADISVDRRRAPQVLRVDRAIGVEHFGVAQRDLRAGGRGDLEPDEADHVLAQVKDVLAGLRFPSSLLADSSPVSRTGWSTCAVKRAGGFGSLRGLAPAAHVQAGLVPAGDFLRRIVIFAQHEVGRRRSGRRGFSSFASVTTRSTLPSDSVTSSCANSAGTFPHA